MSKKVSIPKKPNREQNLDNWVNGDNPIEKQEGTQELLRELPLAPKKGDTQNADIVVEAIAENEPKTPQANKKMKRLTIDISNELHCRIKSHCARRGLKMADNIRELLEQTFPAN